MLEDLCLFLVDINPCVFCHIFHLWVSSAYGKSLFVALIVSSVHLVYFTNLMDFSHIDFVCKPSHARR